MEYLYDKEGITKKDALPIVENVYLVFMVYSIEANSRPERLIINSVGEAGMYIINSNGNIENGDYITSSDYLGMVKNKMKFIYLIILVLNLQCHVILN